MRYHQCDKHGATEVNPSYEGPTVCIPCLEKRPAIVEPKPSLDERWDGTESVLHIGQIAAVGAIPAAFLLLYLGAGLRGALLMVPLTGFVATIFMYLLILWWRSKERR